MSTTPPDITPYCLAHSPDGFVCLRRKHPDDVPHTSADNRVVVDGKPGRIIEWAGDGMPGRRYVEPEAEIARAHGYTGDPCGTCGALRLKRNGACLVCDACGTTTGCS